MKMKVQPQSTRVKAPTKRVPVINAPPSQSGTNDDVFLNLHRRNKSDSRNTGKHKLLNCKKETIIATFNTRTIRLPSKRIELVNNFNTNKIDILGIVDHKIVHDTETIRHEQFDRTYLITSSAWRNSNQAAAGGVGMLISSQAEKTLSEVKSYNERILIADFNGNPRTTVITHYAPVEGSADAEEHYKNLAAAISSIPKHNLLMVIGDCNAHIGPEEARHTFHNETNSNGEHLVNLALETNMIITNTSFQKSPRKLWTFLSDMSGTKTQIDYILVNSKWRNSIKDVEAYSSFSSSGSDHRILSARVKLSLRSCRTPPKRPPYDWSSLRDPNLQAQYSVLIKNRFNVLGNDTASATEKYQQLIIANEEAAKELLPTKKRRGRKQYSQDSRVVQARATVQEACQNYEDDACTANQNLLRKAKENLEAAYNAATEEDLEELVRKVEGAHDSHQHAESWKIINEISDRKTAKQGKIKGTCKKDRLNKWYNHFSDLLGKEPICTTEDDDNIKTIFPEFNISTDPFSIEEYRKVKMKLNTGKAPGHDGIPPEVLKYCDLDEIILQFANDVLTKEVKPEQWSVLDIIPVPKSGDLGLTTNYRGISLSAIAAKMTNKMILNRILPAIDPHLRPNQNGFRPGRTTAAHILALRRIIESAKKFNLKAILVFIDFKKAFDSIHRGKMLKILQAYGIPEKLVKAIAVLYENTKAKVLSPDGETETFSILAGVLQGDTLAPYLFAIIIDYVMRSAVGGKEEALGFTLTPRKSRRVAPVKVTDLMFADDIALLTDEIDQAQTFVNNLETEAQKVGLHINASKTEFMQFNQPKEESLLAKSGQSIKSTDNFKYLGAWMANTEKDMSVRKALAWQACHKLTKVWKSSLSRNIKIRLFVATVETVLLYGSNTWSLTEKLTKQLDGTYTKMLRMVRNISWKSHTTNKELYGHLPKVSIKIAERRLGLAGHCVRHPEEIASNLVLWNPTHGRANTGGQTIDFVDQLYRDTDLTSTKELRNAMEDRDVWRRYISSVRPGSRPK